MDENYSNNMHAKSKIPSQSQTKPGVSMETKLLLAKIGLLICIIILIIARSSY